MFKKLLISALLLSSILPALSDQEVNGYHSSNSSYVQSLEKSTSNNTQYNTDLTKYNVDTYYGEVDHEHIDVQTHNFGYNYGYGSNLYPRY